MPRPSHNPITDTKNLWNSTSPTNASKTCKRAKPRLGGIFDYPLKAERLEEVERELERPSIWDNPEEATKLGQERASLAGVVQGLDDIRQGLQDAFDLIELAEAENDEATVNAALVFNTSNTPAQREQDVFGDPLERIWKDCVFAFCGVHTFARQMFRVVADSDEATRQHWLQQTADMVDKYFPAHS